MRACTLLLLLLLLLLQARRCNTCCIIFLDEMDALLSKRDDGSGSGSSDASRGRILTQLLTLMDGFGSSGSSATSSDSAGKRHSHCTNLALHQATASLKLVHTSCGGAL
jgi:ATPase family associated with various cellular activities (AAA)